MPLELLLYPSQLESCISPNDLLAPRVQGNLISVKRWLASDYTVGFYQHQTPWSPWSLYSRGTSHSNMIDCNMLQFFWRNSHLVFFLRPLTSNWLHSSRASGSSMPTLGRWCIVRRWILRALVRPVWWFWCARVLKSHRIHGAGIYIYMLTWMGYIDGMHVTIYSIHGSYGNWYHFL